MQKNPWNWRKPHAQEPEVAIDEVKTEEPEVAIDEVKTEEPERVAKKKAAKRDG